MSYNQYNNTNISIHALLAESDPLARQKACKANCAFLSTLSLRRATHTMIQLLRCHLISIHALLAESDANTDKKERLISISIHALLAESDPIALP